MPVIEIENLSKRYRSLRGGVTALDGLTLDVPQGGIFGFLGPNGAGKTTTIRCLLGLVRPTSGQLKVLGTNPGSTRDYADVTRRIGALVETPMFLPGISALENLDYLARPQGFGRRSVEDSLELVGLSDRANEPVGKYSTGMRQRLGLAAALCKEPELLILDEPTAGLDPVASVQMRNLFTKLGNEGRTIFFSSHLLSEVEAICQSLAILNHGRCILSGSMAELRRRLGSTQLIVRVGAPKQALAILNNAGFVSVIEGDAVIVDTKPGHEEMIAQTLAAAGIFPKEIKPRDSGLERLFLKSIGEADSR